MPAPPIPRRSRLRPFLALVLVLCSGAALSARAELFVARPADAFTRPDSKLCDTAIATAERNHVLPAHLLGAIGKVESGRRDPLTGAFAPWPWSINVEGEPHTYDTEAAAIMAVRQFQSAGRRSIDIGCMQINLKQHPDAFADLETGFDPTSNARYAADFLTALHDPGQDWLVAAGLYHSATPAIAAPYRVKVAALMAGDTGFRLASAEIPTSLAPRLASAPPLPMPPSGAPGLVLRRMVMRIADRPMTPPSATPGRGLAAYRATPVTYAGLVRPRPPAPG